ncbi:unnamed protein product [Clavelina lepadiformis]|uniref:Uncharacterized protein n=1 Tax=Clavelina lepadiformis TaxID=159417 RepID=A0ABP0EV87_CLALP
MMSPSMGTHSTSPRNVGRQHSNVTLRTNSLGKSTVGWRNEAMWRRQQMLNENCVNQKPQEARSLSSSEDGRLKSMAPRSPNILKNYYLDQQTGEMRNSSNGKTVDRRMELGSDTFITRRSLTDDRLRRRSARESTPPSVQRQFWDHSLKTRSIAISSQHSSRQTPPYVGQNLSAGILPRISRSAENMSAYELPARYPRGQQRPTGLASGHHALLLRHRQILEASHREQQEIKWRQAHYGNPNLFFSNKEMTPNLSATYFKRTNHNQRIGQTTLPANSTSPYYVIMQKRCSQEAASLNRVNKKCKEWFNTWVED